MRIFHTLFTNIIASRLLEEAAEVKQILLFLEIFQSFPLFRSNMGREIMTCSL